MCSTSLLYKILPTNLMTCKPAFYILFIHHIWCKQYYQALFVYRTDFRPELVFFYIFHNFARQIALIYYSRRSKHALTLAQQIIEVNHYKTFSWRKYHDVGTIQRDQSALCIMQGNNGLLAKTFKKAYYFYLTSKFTYTGSRFWLLTSAKFAVRAFFVWMNSK